MKLSSSPSPGRRLAPRVLRVEFNGMPYDWLNLDEMGPRVAHSEQFIATLRDNIVRYFKVPVEVQVCCDEDGPLVSAWDYLRVLQSVSPFIRIFDLREMPGDVKMQVSKKLAAIQQEVAKLQDGLGTQSGGRDVSPWRGTNGASYTSGSTWGTPQPGGRAASPGPPRAAWAYGAGEVAPAGSRGLLPASPLDGSPPGNGATLNGGATVMEPVAQSPGPPGGLGAGGFGAGGFGGAASTAPDEWDPVKVHNAAQGNYAGYTPGLATSFGGSTGPSGGFGGATSFGGSTAATGLAASFGGSAGPAGDSPTLGGAPVGSYAGISTDAPGVKRSTRTTGDLFEVKLQRLGTGKYGFGIQPTLDNRSATVDRIDPDGILARWNMANPAQEVKLGDMIRCVNGVSDNLSDMEQELRTSSLTILFEPC